MDERLRNDGGNIERQGGNMVEIIVKNMRRLGLGGNLPNFIVRDTCTVVCFLAHSLEESTAVKSWTYCTVFIPSA